jgi:ABC-type Fe3+/spermidine/putrescine transport system ATPase subunit
MEGTCDGRGRVTVDGTALEARQGATGSHGAVRLTIRPERVEIAEASSPSANRLAVTVTELVYLGSTTQVLVRTAGGATLQSLVANTGRGLQLARGDTVAAHLPADALRVLAADSEDGS